MRIKTFEYENLNGFLSHKIKLNSDVSFLHGINGSGKTTVLKAITAILTPDLYWLATARYNKLELSIEQDRKTYRITFSKSQDESIAVRLAGAMEAHSVLNIAEILQHIRPETPSAYRGQLTTHPASPDYASKYIVEGNPVLNFVANLPSPIFLGLDRTTLVSAAFSPRWEDQKKNYPQTRQFKTTLDDALGQAIEIVRNRMSTISIQKSRIYQEAQYSLILALFDYSSSNKIENMPNMSPFEESSNKTRHEIVRMQKNVIAGLRKIRIRNVDIDRVVVPFFDQAVERIQKARQAVIDRETAEDGDPVPSDWFKSIDDWFSMRPHLGIVNESLKILEDANNQEFRAVATMQNYIDTINDFVSDSGKKIIVDDRGVKILLADGREEDISIMSSGERQIFVLITHLALNPEMQKANVLIIDEPELSLHLKWQKQFVSSVQKVNKSTQIILATHSPEIINRKLSKTIALKGA